MNIQTTYKDESVNIVETNIDGHNIYVTYIDSEGNLKVDQSYLSAGSAIASDSFIISTSGGSGGGGISNIVVGDGLIKSTSGTTIGISIDTSAIPLNILTSLNGDDGSGAYSYGVTLVNNVDISATLYPIFGEDLSAYPVHLSFNGDIEGFVEGLTGKAVLPYTRIYEATDMNTISYYKEIEDTNQAIKIAEPDVLGIYDIMVSQPGGWTWYCKVRTFVSDGSFMIGILENPEDVFKVSVEDGYLCFTYTENGLFLIRLTDYPTTYPAIIKELFSFPTT